MPIEYVPDRIRFRPEKMLKVGLFDTPRMFCDVYCLEPEQEQAPHTHEGADKLYYVLDGEGEFTLQLTGVDGQIVTDTFSWPSAGNAGQMLVGEDNFH